MNNNNWGGQRPGAGRNRSNEPTVTIRVRVSRKETIVALVQRPLAPSFLAIDPISGRMHAVANLTPYELRFLCASFDLMRLNFLSAAHASLSQVNFDGGRYA